MAEVFVKQGQKIDFDAALAQMDDKIKERLYRHVAPCSNQKFVLAYEAAYEELFGKEMNWNFDNT